MATNPVNFPLVVANGDLAMEVVMAVSDGSEGRARGLGACRR